MRSVRLVLFAGFVFGLVALLAGAVARTYLTSPHAAARAADVLSRSYGAPVRVAEADINLDATSLRGVRVFEAGAGPGDEPWAVADDVQADVSLWDLIGGAAMPKNVRLHRADVTLRFDEAGHLLTALPRRKGGESLPTILIQNGRLTLRQTGRPDLVVHNIDATLQPEGGELILAGAGLDPRWGEWALGGGLDPVLGTSWLTLRSAGPVQLTDEALRGLPFVSPRVWQHVWAEGSSTVELTLRHDPNVERILYRVQLDARNTNLHVIDIDLHATEASGQVLIENGVVTLTGVRGRTGDGDIQTEGLLNFRVSPTRLEFDVKVQRVDIHQLPKKWPMPKFVEGRLTGQANLVVTVVQGKAKTTGQGEGEVLDVPVFGKKATIPLKLNADDKGFHFIPRWPKAI